MTFFDAHPTLLAFTSVFLALVLVVAAIAGRVVFEVWRLRRAAARSRR